MFTGITKVRRLRPREVNLKAVNDINDLLRRQHSEARKIDEDILREQIAKAKVVVAWNDNDRIIGLGVLVKTLTLSHTFATIHNLVVCEGSDRLSVGKQIVDLLVEGVGDVAFIEASAWPDDGDLINLLTVCRFKPKHKLRYRFKIKVPKATPALEINRLP